MLLVRAALAVVAFVATNYFIFWMAAAMLPLGSAAPLVASLLAFAGAVAAAWYVWQRGPRASWNSGLGRYVLKGAIITGAIGFVGGFFGPMVFAPDANQGPLLGLFITGPGGFVLGAVGGAVYWMTSGRPGA